VFKFRVDVLFLSFAIILLGSAVGIALEKMVALWVATHGTAFHSLFGVLAGPAVVSVAAGLPTKPPVCLYKPPVSRLLLKLTRMVLVCGLTVAVGLMIYRLMQSPGTGLGEQVGLGLSLLMTVASFGWSALLALGLVLQHRRDCAWAEQHA